MRISDWSSDVCSSDLKRAVERVSNVTPTTDQIEGDQHGTEAKQAAKARKVTGPRLMTVIPTKQQPAIRTWKASKETGTQTARAVTRKGHRTWLCRQSMRAFHPGGRLTLRLSIRSEERRVGKGCVRTGRYGWERYSSKKEKQYT